MTTKKTTTPTPIANNPEFAMPEGLSKAGKTAHAVVLTFLQEGGHDYVGGQIGFNTFRSPKDWKKRGEEWGADSELVLIYDGGPLFSIISTEFGGKMRTELDKRLAAAGLFFEPATAWFGFIYKTARR